jgi:hypothetical protein
VLPAARKIGIESPANEQGGKANTPRHIAPKARRRAHHRRLDADSI